MLLGVRKIEREVRLTDETGAVFERVGSTLDADSRPPARP